MEDEELSDEEKQDLYERTHLILEEARSQFDRFHSNVNSINTKIVSLFQIFLVVVTIQVTVFLYYLDIKEIECISYCIFSCLILVSTFTFISFIYLMWPKEYEYPSLFGEERFSELSVAEKHEIVSDFYYHTKKSYDFNQKTYCTLKSGFEINLVLILLNMVFFGILAYSFI